MESQAERVLSFRRAGLVRRCHALPQLGSDYTVGKHSWDAATLLLLLHPGPSLELVKAVMWHDMQEWWIGDQPRHCEDWSQELASEYQRAGARVDVHLGLGFIARLPEDDRRWLRAVDTLEFILWCEDQRKLGNLNLADPENRAKEYLRRDPPPEITRFLKEQKV